MMPSVTELAACGVVLWLGFELLFYFVVMQDWKRGMDVLTPTPPYRLDPEVLITNVFRDLETLQGYSVIKFLEGWFLGASLSDVKRGNAEEFLAWAMYNTHRVNLSMDELAAVGRVLAEIQRRFGISFAPGLNAEVKCSNFTLSSASSHLVHRPLVFYASVAIAKVVSHTLLFQAGFVPYRCGPLAYWYRPCIGRPEGSPEPLPIIFFHGIGPGLFVYVGLLKNLVQGRAALLVEMPHVGMGLDLRPPTQEQTVNAVRRALKRHGIARVCVVGHSYGTFCAGWMATGAKDVVAQLVLLDPMCLLLALPDVTYNFLYRKPTTWMQALVHYGAGSEMGINNSLRRHFWWFNSVVFAHEIADIPTVVHLASDDAIAPSAHIADYLGAHFAARLKVTGMPNEAPGDDRLGEAPCAASTAHPSSAASEWRHTGTAAGAGGNSSSLASEDEGVPRPPPPSRSSPPRGSPKCGALGGSWSAPMKGHSSTLELVWSEGFAHGQIIFSPSRQKEIARRIFLQECRIFAEETNSGRDRASAASSGLGAGLGGAKFTDGRGSRKVILGSPIGNRGGSLDEFGWDEPSPRLC